MIVRMEKEAEGLLSFFHPFSHPLNHWTNIIHSVIGEIFVKWNYIYEKTGPASPGIYSGGTGLFCVDSYCAE